MTIINILVGVAVSITHANARKGRTTGGRPTSRTTNLSDTAGAWWHLAFVSDSIIAFRAWAVVALGGLLVRDDRKGHRIRFGKHSLNHNCSQLLWVIASPLSSGTLAHRVLMVLGASLRDKGID
jgi:hypothetical protein